LSKRKREKKTKQKREKKKEAAMCRVFTFVFVTWIISVAWASSDIKELWTRVNTRVDPDSRSSRLLQAIACRPDFHIVRSYLPFQRHFHDGAGYIDGVTSAHMSSPVMWGVDIYDRLYLAVRTTCSVEVLGSAPLPREVGPDDLVNNEWYYVASGPGQSYVHKFFTQYTLQRSFNHSACVKVRQCGRNESGVVTLFERYTHQAAAVPPTTSFTKMSWSIGSRGDTIKRVLRFKYWLTQTYLTYHLGDDGGQEEKALFRILTSNVTSVYRRHWSSVILVFRYMLV
jgi:hypothetical protein